MFLTEFGFSTFQRTDPPTGFLATFAHHDESTPPIVEAIAENVSRVVGSPLESSRIAAGALKGIVYRILGVVALVGISLFVHALALLVAERAYAPYRIGRTGEYAAPASDASLEHRDLASARPYRPHPDRRR